MNSMSANKKRKFPEWELAVDIYTRIKSQLEEIKISLVEQRNQSNSIEPVLISEEMKSVLENIIMLFIDLKQANREVHLELEKRKMECQKMKQSLDKLFIDLQALLSERHYLELAIRKCRDFSSQEKEISLLTEEEFLRVAPIELTSDTDPHQHMLNRLRFELQQRKTLCVELQELKARKRALTELNVQKKRNLEGFQNRLKSVITAANTLQQYLQTLSSSSSALAPVIS